MTDVPWSTDPPIYGGLLNVKPDHQHCADCPDRCLAGSTGDRRHPSTYVGPVIPWLTPQTSERP